MTTLRSMTGFLLVTLLVAGTGCGGADPRAMTPAMAPPPVAQAATPRPLDAAGSAPAAESAMAAPPAPAAGPGAQAPAAQAPGAPGRAAPAPAAPPPKATPDVASKAAKTAAPTRAPVILYESDLRMLADEAVIPKTLDRIIDVAESLGGHIAGRKDVSVTIKVPSAQFREALTRIDALGVPVTHRSVKADDVSEEFHDLEVRLVNLKATRARLGEFLARAANIPDMLTVERELERVAMEIDRIEGRLEFLRTRAAMSTISVAIDAKPKVAPIVLTTSPPPPPPPALRTPEIPVAWISRVGVDPLLSLQK